MGKFFDVEIFILEYVLDHSESIPTKKNFSTKIFWLCHFFTILVILAEKSPTKTSERRGALQSGQMVSELGSNLKLSLMASELGSHLMVS